MKTNANATPLEPRIPNVFRVLLALLLRELITSYPRMPGKHIWSFFQPLAMIAIIAVAFSFVLKTPPLGTSFILFYATGILPLRNFQEVSRSISMGIHDNRALLAYPRVAPIDVLIARFILFSITQIVVFFVIVTTILLTQNHHALVDPLPLLQAYGLVWILSFGWGIFNAIAFLRIPIWKTLWTIITQPLILISGVLFLIETLARPASTVLILNPLAHIIALTRKSFYPSYDPDFVSPIYVIAFSLIPLFFGLVLLRRYGRNIINY